MSCGIGCRQGSDPTLVLLWHSPAATALIWPLEILKSKLLDQWDHSKSILNNHFSRKLKWCYFLQTTFNGYIVKFRDSDSWEGDHLGSCLPGLGRYPFSILFQGQQMNLPMSQKMYPPFSFLLLPPNSSLPPNSLLFIKIDLEFPLWLSG